MSDLVNKWEKTGLLDGLTEVQKIDLSSILEQVAEFLLTTQKVEEIPRVITGGLLPCAVRIYRNRLDVEIHPNKLYDLYKKMYEFSFPGLKNTASTFLAAESALCELVEREYINPKFGGE